MSDNFKVSKSRVAKKFVELPSSLKMSLSDGLATFSNSVNDLSMKVPFGVDLISENGKLFVVEKSKNYLHFAGTSRSTISNIVKGLTSGFTKDLKLVGVGFKASIVGSKITMNLGYSHPVVFELPIGVGAVLPSPTEIKLSSHDCVLLGDTSAKMCKLRKRDSYHGKGVIDLGIQYQSIKEGKRK